MRSARLRAGSGRIRTSHHRICRPRPSPTCGGASGSAVEAPEGGLLGRREERWHVAAAPGDDVCGGDHSAGRAVEEVTCCTWPTLLLGNTGALTAPAERPSTARRRDSFAAPASVACARGCDGGGATLWRRSLAGMLCGQRRWRFVAWRVEARWRRRPGWAAVAVDGECRAVSVQGVGCSGRKLSSAFLPVDMTAAP